MGVWQCLNKVKEKKYQNQSKRAKLPKLFWGAFSDLTATSQLECACIYISITLLTVVHLESRCVFSSAHSTSLSLSSTFVDSISNRNNRLNNSVIATSVYLFGIQLFGDQICWLVSHSSAHITPVPLTPRSQRGVMRGKLDWVTLPMMLFV